jgi:hypothetical protein
MKFSYLIVLFGTLAGCTKAPTKIGTSCNATTDCNIAGQVCVGGICTHACTGQFNQCPVGYNCTIVDPGSGLTCNKVAFAVDPTTGVPLLYGKSCPGGDASICGNPGDPAVPSPICRSAQDPFNPGMPLANDAGAYCTGACSSDNDCPFFMSCTADYDGIQKCLTRAQCSSCTYNDNCNADGGNLYACIPASKGGGNYCTATCNSDNDCPGAVQAQAAGTKNYLSCQAGMDATGNAGKFCVHWYGACVGQGNVCDPCQTTADCALSSSKCIRNPYTQERMCTKKCTADAQCTSPNQASCDDTDLPSASNPAGVSTGLCTGDSTRHQYPGVFSCLVGL